MLYAFKYRDYQLSKKHPKADLTAENTFFSFALRRALNQQTTSENDLIQDKKIHFQKGEETKISETLKKENRLQTLSFYLKTVAQIAPQKVFDIDVGSGRWAVLLRDLFELSTDKKDWQLSVAALVETKPKASEISQFFYDRVQIGKLEDCVNSIKEKQDLIILGDYLTRNGNFQNENILEQTLNLSDYILLNLNPKNNGFENSNSEQNLLQYLSSHPEQVAAFQTSEIGVSVLLSRNDPKKLLPNSQIAEVFCKTAENCGRQNEESISGPGSSLKSTTEIRRSLPLLFACLEINSMLDARCGDFNWLRHVDLKLEKYIGVDIVPSIIEQNRIRFENRNRKFFAADITVDFLPKTDLILCRDFLVHLSFAEIFSALHNFYQSGAKYLLTTTFPKSPGNSDIKTGDWRTLNLQLPPFNFPSPVKLLNERCTEGCGKFADKSLGLWKISDIYRIINRH